MILSKMCKILLKKRKRNAIVAWRAYLKLKDQLEAKKSIITAHLSRTMSKWLNRDKARVIRTWKDKVNEIQTNRRLVARAMGRWTKRCMYSCWASWVEYANTKVRNRRLIAKIRARWLKQLESKSFRTWFSFLEDRKKLRLKMRKAFEKFKQGSQRKVFMEWKEIPILLKRRKVLMGRIVRRWRKTHLTRGIGKWRTYTVAERILGRKRKPQGAPPPVVEEELSSESVSCFERKGKERKKIGFRCLFFVSFTLISQLTVFFFPLLCSARFLSFSSLLIYFLSPNRHYYVVRWNVVLYFLHLKVFLLMIH